MRIAVLADAKANEPALLAVLAAVDRLHVERIWHIGSMLSYGPDPVAVADRMRQVTEGRYCLGSMLDAAIIGDRRKFIMPAYLQRSVPVVRRQLRPSWLAGRAVRERWAWLQRLPATGDEGSLQLFSGTPTGRLDGILPISPLAVDGGLGQQLAAVRDCAVIGMLGLPGIAWESDALWRAVPAESSVDASRGRCIACPGAVGQPRDGDPRAGFLLWDDGHLTWQRVAYDVAETQRRILAHPGLAPTYAQRLAFGR